MEVVWVYVVDAETDTEGVLHQIRPQNAGDGMVGLMCDTAPDRSSPCCRTAALGGSSDNLLHRRKCHSAAVDRTTDAESDDAELG